jgi:aldehyde:ferredoxin oxidoreductase
MTSKSEICGYNAKILKVNLSMGSIEVEEPCTTFYRTYLGGALLGACTLLKETKAGVDPLSPENIIVFATSITTGAPKREKLMDLSLGWVAEEMKKK